MSHEELYYWRILGKKPEKLRIKITMATVVDCVQQWKSAHLYEQGSDFREAYFWLLNERRAECIHEKVKDSRKKAKG